MKYLGVILSSNLTWSDHINTTCKAAKRQIGLVYRQLHLAPPEVRLKVINSTILPKLEYCSAIWNPHLKKDIANLDNVQKFARRTVTTINLIELQLNLNWQPLKKHKTKGSLQHSIPHSAGSFCSTPFSFLPTPSQQKFSSNRMFPPFLTVILFSWM